MTEDARDLYSRRLLDLAARPGPVERLPAPDATATADSPLCGSRISIDLMLRNGVVTAYAHKVRACIIGQAVATIVAEAAIGLSAADLRAGHHILGALLQDGTPVPPGPWSGLQLLAPVRGYPTRHGSALLPFVAIHRALSIPRLSS